MNRILTRIIPLLCGSCAPALALRGQNAAREALTNKDIVVMTSSGMSSPVIKAAIGKSNTNFDLSASGLIQLKRSGISDDILLTMITKASTAAATAPEDTLRSMSPGVYNRSVKGYRPVDGHMLLSEDSKGAVGSLKRKLQTLVNLPVKAYLPGKQASLVCYGPTVAFVFVLDLPAKIPEDFLLVKLRQSGDARQISFQKSSGIGSPLIKINDTLKITFTSRRILDGIYAVSPTHPLAPGEYCFLYSATALYKGSAYKVFDFSVLREANANP